MPFRNFIYYSFNHFRPRAQCFTLSIRPRNDIELEFPLQTNDETNDSAHGRNFGALRECASNLDLLEDSLIYPSCFHILFQIPLWRVMQTGRCCCQDVANFGVIFIVCTKSDNTSSKNGFEDLTRDSNIVGVHGL